jgi:hypothetical protein
VRYDPGLPPCSPSFFKALGPSDHDTNHRGCSLGASNNPLAILYVGDLGFRGLEILHLPPRMR